MFRNEDIDTVVGSAFVVFRILALWIRKEVHGAIHGLGDSALVGMREHLVLHIALCNGAVGNILRLFSAVHQCRHADSLGRNLLSLQRCRTSA